jgi:hypothetical protein
MKRLTDHQVAEIRAQAASGRPRPEIAEYFHVSRRHVDRLVAGLQRQVIRTEADAPGPVAVAVRRFLDDLDLDHGNLVLAATAETLAVKLDAVRVSEAAAAATAAPGLARGLADVLRELRGLDDDATVAARRLLQPFLGRA